MRRRREDRPNLWRAILTDVQFWIPVIVLGIGVILLIFIHNK